MPEPPNSPLSLSFAAAGELDRIVLTGFMGSGKSTLGRLIAARLGWRFVDLDDEIARAEHRSIAQIFEHRGEAHFRSLETAALRDALRLSHLVLALGGGAASVFTNRELLLAADHTVVIYLTAAFDTLYTRCADQHADPAAALRPLLGDPAAAAQRLAGRDPHYRAVANLVLDSTSQSPDETVSAMLEALGMRL